MNKKAIALLLCTLLCFAMASSFVLIAEAVDHHCPGHDCHICLELKASLSLLNSMFLVVIAAFSLAAIAGPAHRLPKNRLGGGRGNTLVSLKVQLTI
ncbi:MAG: hypothetical protein AAGU12_15960 [Clostridiales bacterium]